MPGLEMILLLYALTGIKDGEQIEASDYLSTETPYPFRKQNYTEPPTGYTPFFINYLGRHSQKKKLEAVVLERLDNLLKDARVKEGLTSKGVRLKTAVEAICKEEKKAGAAKEDLIVETEVAKRLCDEFRSVFGKEIQAVAAKDQASQMSMEVFVEYLRKQMPNSHYQMAYYTDNDPILKFYQMNNAYREHQEKGRWRRETEHYKKRNPDIILTLGSFFNEQYSKEIADGYQCLEDIYRLYMTEYSRLKALNLEDVLDDKVLQYYWSNENVSNYSEKGPGMEQGIVRTMAFPLLGDFLVTTQKEVERHQTSMYLRFADERTFIPFINILNLPGYTSQTNNYEQVEHLWRDEKIAPRGANVSWVLYRHERTRDVLIKMLYNEKEVALPIESKIQPYYRWKDVRKYYIRVLQNLGVNWQQNSIDIVKQYK